MLTNPRIEFKPVRVEWLNPSLIEKITAITPLFLAMVSREAVDVKNYKGEVIAHGLINMIEAEDGSGRNFNVCVTNGTVSKTIYVRTI